MKINIITIHSIPNFGSVFQSYALCEHLKKEGYTDVDLIDYTPGYYQSKTLRAFVGRMLNYGHYRRRTKKFREFIGKNLPLTKQRFTDSARLTPAALPADVYIAGGDQLWNPFHPCGEDDAYKLSWAKGKKISYGTSLGQTAFTDSQLQALAKGIADFSAVSVRESSSVELLARAGISATHCADPVYLLKAEDYLPFIKPVNQPRYMMVYLVTPSPLLNECVKRLSERFGLKVILCSGFSKKCPCDEFLKDLGPDEILSYIYHADLVLSSSFHATAFSLMFQKQFFTILPGEHTNERIVDLLNMRTLSHRIVTDQTSLDTLGDTPIDYQSIPSYEPFISSSKEYLKKALRDE